MKNFYAKKSQSFEGGNGFTLVELLIVIVVIGVLSAMMMLSSTESVTTAKAIKIISDLNVLKRAVMAWYLDNLSRIQWDTTQTNGNGFKVDGKTEIHEALAGKSGEIKKYLSSAFALNTGEKSYTKFYCAVDGFSVYMGNANTRCYVVYRISDNGKPAQKALKEKLKKRAAEAGLLGYSQGKEPWTYKGDDCVFMECFSLKDYDKRNK